jgi:4'-phosphopantetheinyl transferase
VEEAGPACGWLHCFELQAPPAEFDSLAALLSDGERARAARFHFADHAARFTVAHGRLRQWLAPLLGIAPERVAFTAGPHGKPALAGDAAGSGIQFNLSHSDTLGLVGWCAGRHIGVDIERWRSLRDEAALARRYFSAGEAAAYEALPAEHRSEGFFNCWTRKEAYVKAVGRGLTLPLDSFDVALQSGPAARLLRSSPLVDDGRVWSLAAPQGPPGSSLAVVLEVDSLFVRNA